MSLIFLGVRDFQAIFVSFMWLVLGRLRHLMVFIEMQAFQDDQSASRLFRPA
jgi:hypothetical protein